MVNNVKATSIRSKICMTINQNESRIVQQGCRRLRVRFSWHGSDQDQ